MESMFGCIRVGNPLSSWKSICLYTSSYRFSVFVKQVCEGAFVPWSLCFPVARRGRECDDGSTLSPSVTPFFFIYHDNCMLSKAPENAAQAAAIKTRHQKERKKKKSKVGKRKKNKKEKPSALLQIIPTEWKVLWQQYTFLPITQRTKCHAMKNWKGCTDCVKHFVHK